VTASYRHLDGIPTAPYGIMRLLAWYWRSLTASWWQYTKWLLHEGVLTATPRFRVNPTHVDCRVDHMSSWLVCWVDWTHKSQLHMNRLIWKSKICNMHHNEHCLVLVGKQLQQKIQMQIACSCFAVHSTFWNKRFYSPTLFAIIRTSHEDSAQLSLIANIMLIS